MDIIVRKPLYSKLHGDIDNFIKFKDVFPDGVELCNGRKLECTRKEFVKFRHHILNKGKKCKCPTFENETNEDIVLRQNQNDIESLTKKIKQYKIIFKKLDEERIFIERELSEKDKKFKLVKDLIKTITDNIKEEKEISRELLLINMFFT